MLYKTYYYLLAIIFLASCTTTRNNPSELEKDIVELTIIQLNDVYEIAPLEGGKKGGLARVATLKKELEKENPNTIAVLSGDFLSPSLIGTLKKENGERIAGQQMIETLNAMGLDYATFGNHEFDLKTADILQKRIDQSEFEYTICNVSRSDKGKLAPFTQLIDGQRTAIPKYIIKEIKGQNGKLVKVGIIGVVLPFNQKDFVAYDPVVASFKKAYDAIKDQTDFVIALTHLNIEEDLSLAKEVPGVLIFLGGHDHVNMNHYVEETVITKADANAKTVYVHRIRFSPHSKMAKVRSSLMPINDKIASDPATQRVIEGWQNKVDKFMKDQGYMPDEVIMNTDEPLECKEHEIRSRPTNFGTLTVDAFEAALPGARAYMINSGSMRLDDNIEGTVTQYDILRTFPYGGNIVQMTIPGNVLQKLLEVALITNKGDGGYFQVNHVSKKNGQWMLDDKPINVGQKYLIVIPEFVAKGLEANLGFLKDFNYQVPKKLTDGVKNDIRDIVIAYMKKQ